MYHNNEQQRQAIVIRSLSIRSVLVLILLLLFCPIRGDAQPAIVKKVLGDWTLRTAYGGEGNRVRLKATKDTLFVMGQDGSQWGVIQALPLSRVMLTRNPDGTRGFYISLRDAETDKMIGAWDFTVKSKYKWIVAIVDENADGKAYFATKNR